MGLVFVLKWVKTVLRHTVYIFHLSAISPINTDILTKNVGSYASSISI